MFIIKSIVKFILHLLIVFSIITTTAYTASSSSHPQIAKAGNKIIKNGKMIILKKVGIFLTLAHFGNLTLEKSKNIEGSTTIESGIDIFSEIIKDEITDLASISNDLHVLFTELKNAFLLWIHNKQIKELKNGISYN